MEKTEWDLAVIAISHFHHDEYTQTIQILDSIFPEYVISEYAIWLKSWSLYQLGMYPRVVSLTTKVLNQPNIDLKQSLDMQFYYKVERFYKGTNIPGSIRLKSDFLLLRAMSKFMLQDYLGTKNDIDLFMKTCSLNTDILFLLGCFEIETNEIGEAILNFKKILNQKVDYNDQTIGRAYYYLGICYKKIGSFENALMNFSKAGEYGISEAYDQIKLLNSNK